MKRGLFILTLCFAAIFVSACGAGRDEIAASTAATAAATEVAATEQGAEQAATAIETAAVEQDAKQAATVTEVPTAEQSAEQAATATEAPATEAAPTAEQDAGQAAGGMVISVGALTAEPQFIDWTQDGTAMQVIALRDGAGEAQLAYNTCQVCAGSPYAYFEYQDGMLVCQNCGNRFSLSAVGKVSGGCNPKPVGEYRLEGDRIVISEETLAQAAASFKNWKVFR